MSDIASIADTVRDGHVDAAEPARTAAARLNELNGGSQGLNAFLAALSDVEASSLVVPTEGGRISGVPIAVKDNLTTLEFPTTCGSKILEGYRPSYEATVVRRLREEGRRHRGEDQSRRVRHGVFDGELGVWACA